MTYFKSQILPSKLTYRTVTQDLQISSDSAYIPITFSTIQGLKYVTVKLTQDRGGGTVYEGSATIPVSKISGSSAIVARIYLNNNFVDAPFRVDLSMSYTGASIDYSGTYYNMYITILGFPMDIFAPLSLDKIPYIFGDQRQYIITPIIDSNVNKVEIDIYITKSSLSNSAIMGSQWGGSNWLLAQDGNLAWMTSPRTTFASNPIAIGGHKLVMDLENGSTYDGVSVSSPGATIGNVNKNICLFASDDTGGNKADIGIGRTKFYNHSTMLMDLVPINAVNTDAMVLLNNAEYLGYGYQSYSADLRNITPIRDTLRLRTRYLDTNGVMHYANDYTIAISDLSSASWDVRPYTTFDDGQQVQWVIKANSLYYQMNELPTGAIKVFADVTVSGTQKEGGFYDTVNDKYYFSETSTPLVYSEL